MEIVIVVCMFFGVCALLLLFGIIAIVGYRSGLSRRSEPISEEEFKRYLKKYHFFDLLKYEFRQTSPSSYRHCFLWLSYDESKTFKLSESASSVLLNPKILLVRLNQHPGHPLEVGKRLVVLVKDGELKFAQQ